MGQKQRWTLASFSFSTATFGKWSYCLGILLYAPALENDK